jgi:Reverse transcriptase (RNA-dependent DNA polymerase)
MFQFRCLLFGLSSAPRDFTKVLKVVVMALRKKGIRLIIYLDDILLMNASRRHLLDNLSTTIQLLTSLGFLINWEKSICIPTQQIEYLGLIVDSRQLSLALPREKLVVITLHAIR